MCLNPLPRNSLALLELAAPVGVGGQLSAAVLLTFRPLSCCLILCPGNSQGLISVVCAQHRTPARWAGVAGHRDSLDSAVQGAKVPAGLGPDPHWQHRTSRLTSSSSWDMPGSKMKSRDVKPSRR